MKKIILFFTLLSLCNFLIAQGLQEKKLKGNNDTTGTVTDIEGNIYKTIKIGTQWWMAENLKSSKYTNGDTIYNLTSYPDWITLPARKGAWCYYNYDTVNNITYGKLYNWYAIADTLGLCPSGWHVPGDNEWTELSTYLGGGSAHLKEADTTHWNSPNTDADNSSGFTALPGGTLTPGGNFYGFGTDALFGSSTSTDTANANVIQFSYNVHYFYDDPDLKVRFVSVRCLMNDNPTGIKKMDNLYNMKIYPNPAKDLIAIEIPKTGNENILSITDISGREMFKQNILTDKTQINISNLPQGFYFVKIENDKIVIVKKIVKE